MAEAVTGPAPSSTGAAARVRAVAGARFLGVPRWFWLAATVAGLVLVGPGLAPGAWLNLDLVVLADNPLPRGAWGLGPELPRRVPLWIPIAWLSALGHGELVGRVFVVGCIVAACCGAYRLAGRHVLTGVTAGVLYGLGPFLTTRIAVGHWMVVWAMAVLPWAVNDLLRPVRSPRRVLGWSAALGVAGVYGGILAAPYLCAGLIVDRRPVPDHVGRRRLAAVAAFLVGQLPWLVPLVVVGSDTGARTMSDSSTFPPPLAGLGDLGRLGAGLGFWNPPFQIAKGAPVSTAVVGVVVVALAVVGTFSLPRRWRWPVTIIGVASMVVAASSALPGIDHLASWFTATTLGTPFRETQRYLAPFLLWSAPAAALGARRVAERMWAPGSRAWLGAMGGLVAALPLVGGLLLASSAMWGLAGQLRPVTFPPDWARAKAVVDAEPGTVVAFPWFEYFTLDLADNRLVLNVVPYYLGGDVIASSDPLLVKDRVQESSDPREAEVGVLADAARAGSPISQDLAALGVRWIVLQHDVNWQAYTGVLEDPGLETVVEGDSVTLYRVRSWPGSVVDSSGQVVDSDPLLSPWLDVAPSGEATWAAPFQSGWLRGTGSTAATPAGLVALPSGSGPVWFWPAALVIAADLVTLVAVVVSALTRPRRRRDEEPAGPTGSPGSPGSTAVS